MNRYERIKELEVSIRYATRVLRESTYCGAEGEAAWNRQLAWLQKQLAVAQASGHGFGR